MFLMLMVLVLFRFTTAAARGSLFFFNWFLNLSQRGEILDTIAS